MSDETMVCGRRVHPLCSVFPPMSEKDYARLVESLRTSGYDKSEPVVTHEDQILDGRHRAKACAELGIAPEWKAWEGEHGSPAAFVIARNLARRHMTTRERSEIAAKIANLADGQRADLAGASDDAPAPITQAQAADMMGVSRSSVQRAAAKAGKAKAKPGKKLPPPRVGKTPKAPSVDTEAAEAAAVAVGLKPEAAAASLEQERQDEQAPDLDDASMAGEVETIAVKRLPSCVGGNPTSNPNGKAVLEELRKAESAANDEQIADACRKVVSSVHVAGTRDTDRVADLVLEHLAPVLTDRDIAHAVIRGLVAKWGSAVDAA